MKFSFCSLGGFNIKLGLRTKFSFSFFLFFFELILWSSKDNTSHLLKRFDFAIETPLSKYNNLTASSTLLNILLLVNVCLCVSPQSWPYWFYFICLYEQITSATGGQFQAFFATPTCQQIQGWNEGLWFSTKS